MENLLKIKSDIEAELNKYFAGTTFFLVEVKVAVGYKIAVFADGEENITIQECTKISRYLEAFLESNALVPEQYGIEVSSPGMDQPLKVMKQYIKAIGRDVEVVLKDGRKLEGILKEANEEGISLEETKKLKAKQVETILHQIAFDDIKTTKKSIKF